MCGNPQFFPAGKGVKHAVRDQLQASTFSVPLVPGLQWTAIDLAVCVPDLVCPVTIRTPPLARTTNCTGLRIAAYAAPRCGHVGRCQHALCQYRAWRRERIGSYLVFVISERCRALGGGRTLVAAYASSVPVIA
eukprot:1564825-Rhodomonas_salina.1